jgi:ribose transport system ATP-binding protein
MSEQPVLELTGVTKTYPGVKALLDLDFDLRPGEIHGIAGRNGAGKSTLIKILSGAELPDSGTIAVKGGDVRLHSPEDAQRLGIFTIYQELSLVPQLSVAENICVGDLPTGPLGVIHWRRARAEALQALAPFGVDIDVAVPVGSLSVSLQQIVELAKALRRRAEVVLLDEPTATLPPPDVERLFAVLRTLQSRRPVSLIYISHKLEEVFEICQRVTVLRDGRKVGTFVTQEATPAQIARAMVGTDLESIRQREAARDHKPPRLGTGGDSADPVLTVEGLSDGARIRDIGFTLGRGEILGITGLVGSGQSELALCLFGARPVAAGRLVVQGLPLRPTDPIASIQAGIGLLPQDRKTQGLVLQMSVADNIVLPNLPSVTRVAVISTAMQRDLAERMRRALQIKVRRLQQKVVTLSGGNQQKVVLAKWLASKARILIFDEPTRGIDIAAKEEIYELIRRFVLEGGSVLMMSSDLAETLMCDRILVMARGRIVGEFAYDEVDPNGAVIAGLCY